MIDLHSVVAFFHKAKWTGRDITHEIGRVPGEDTISYSTVGTCVQMFVLSTKETDTPIVPKSETNFSLDYPIIAVLSRGLFMSVRQTARMVMMSKSIVYRHLTQTMRWKLRHVQGFPHSPTESEKMNRVQRATKLLELLESIRHEVWQHIVTLDDS
jgi:hypothetical protein